MVRVSYLDIRSQVANCRVKIKGFKLKDTILEMCQNIENNKEATSKVFRI